MYVEERIFHWTDFQDILKVIVTGLLKTVLPNSRPISLAKTVLPGKTGVVAVLSKHAFGSRQNSPSLEQLAQGRRSVIA